MCFSMTLELYLNHSNGHSGAAVNRTHCHEESGILPILRAFMWSEFTGATATSRFSKEFIPDHFSNQSWCLPRKMTAVYMAP